MSNPSPLKGKVMISELKEYPKFNLIFNPPVQIRIYHEKDVKAALEWLINDLKNRIHPSSPVELNSGFSFSIAMIMQAFPDILEKEIIGIDIAKKGSDKSIINGKLQKKDPVEMKRYRLVLKEKDGLEGDDGC